MKFLKLANLILLACVLVNINVSYAIDVFPSNLQDLKTLNNSELSELYGYGSAFVVPSASTPGKEMMYEGVPLPIPGTPGPSELLSFFWGGKAFTTDDNGETSLKNKILPTTPLSFNEVSASVYIVEDSLTDDSLPVVLLDYYESNVSIARGIRDEIRLIAPGLYLGRAYMKNSFFVRLLTGREYSFVLWFALQEPDE